jgi:methylated-DNA-[protein]-cysteine S-methyltransferase
LAISCFRRIGEAWFGVALDDSEQVLSCGFSTRGRKDIVNSVLSNLPADTSISEASTDKYALAILESLSLIYEGKDPKVRPTLAWDNLPPFHRRALKLTALIPRGKVATYGGIAAGIGEPNGARAVGNAEASNPFAPLMPCHRVISSSLGLGGYGGGLDAKRAFLIREGVVFIGDRVAPEFVWTPDLVVESL